VWRTDDYSGDWQASCTWSAPADHEPPDVGSTFEVVEHGHVLWGGVMGEPAYGSGGWELHAYGYGSVAKDYVSQANTASPGDPPIYELSTVPNDVVDAAIEFGAPWVRSTNLGTSAIWDPNQEIADLATLLMRVAKAQGKRLVFSPQGEISFADDPTTPSLITRPGEAYLGTANDEFVTDLFGYYTPDDRSIITATITGVPTGGTFTLSGNGATTAGLAYNVSAAAMETAIQGLGGVFSAALVGQPQTWVYEVDIAVTGADLTGSGALLTGGTTPGITVQSGPAHPASVQRIDDEAAEQFGRRQRGITLFARGAMTSTEAQAYIDGVFALTGARMGWTNGLTLSRGNLRRMGAGPASPRHVRAGEMLRIPGVADTRSQTTTRAAVDIILGQVEVSVSDETAAVTPVGLVPRDFTSALAAPPAPATVAAAS
jgi:hypothetical protein